MRAIEADGWPITERIEIPCASDAAADVAAAAGAGLAGFARAFARDRPDLVVVLGDRLEMLAAAVAALPLTIPVAHIHGGEVTEGAIDEQARHAITKLAHLHFPAAEPTRAASSRWARSRGGCTAWARPGSTGSRGSRRCRARSWRARRAAAAAPDPPGHASIR